MHSIWTNCGTNLLFYREFLPLSLGDVIKMQLCGLCRRWWDMAPYYCKVSQ